MDARDGLLECIECGYVSGELGRGWAAFRCEDPDEDVTDPPAVALYCPPCAAAEFGFRAEPAEGYV
jgi:hypothetical protein